MIIARGDKPVARLVSFGEIKGKRQPGALKGELHGGPEFFAPLPPEELAAGDSAFVRAYWIRMSYSGGFPMIPR